MYLIRPCLSCGMDYTCFATDYKWAQGIGMMNRHGGCTEKEIALRHVDAMDPYQKFSPQDSIILGYSWLVNLVIMLVWHRMGYPWLLLQTQMTFHLLRTLISFPHKLILPTWRQSSQRKISIGRQIWAHLLLHQNITLYYILTSTM